MAVTEFSGFGGYLFKFGQFPFPMEHIEWDSYSSAPGQRQSLDAYTDENGVTHDNALGHSKTEVKFSTLPMSEKEWIGIMSNMVGNYRNRNARDAICSYYDFELCTYRTGHFYFDKSFRASANIVGGELMYNKADWTFIEY